MANKEKIKEIMKQDRLPFEFIAKLLGIDESDYMDLENTLASMVEAGELKYNENTGLYHVSKRRFLSKDSVYNVIKESDFIKENTLAKVFNVKFKELKAITNELISEGKIVFAPMYSIYGIPKIASLEIKDRGYAFAIVEGEENNYYISPDFVRDAYNGDTVSILVIGKVNPDDKLDSAIVCNIIERKHKNIIGILSSKGKKYPKYFIRSNAMDFLVPADVDKEEIKDLSIGQIVMADLEYVGVRLIAKNLSLVGNPNDPGIEITEIALA